MCFWKKLFVVGSAAVMLLGGLAMAQAPAHTPAQAPAHTPAQSAAEAAAAEEAAEEAAAEEAAIEAQEEAAAEQAAAEQPAPEPEPIAAAPEPAPEPAKVEKPKPSLEVTPYGTASYRFRGRLWNASADTGTNPNKKSVSGSTMDYFNLLGWFVGLKAKVDDQLSLEFRIGNDFNSGEEVSWTANRASQGRTSPVAAGEENIYVHLAYATWNPGPIYLSGGVIPVSSNGTLDLLERSLNTGSYGDAIFQTWQSVFNNRLMAIKLGAPILQDDFKLGVELTSSVIYNRNTRGSLILGYAATGANHTDTSVNKDPAKNPAGLLFIFDVPIGVGDLKITPELTGVLNRNIRYDAGKKELLSDHEIIGGLSASYKVNKELSLSLNGAYGTVSNKKSKNPNGYGPFYGNGSALSDVDDTGYVSQGLIAGIGGSYKAGPGSLAIDFKYGNAVDAVSDLSKVATDKHDILADVRYTWNVHSKFSIQPRWRLYMTMYDKDSEHITQKMENRPELILTGQF